MHCGRARLIHVVVAVAIVSGVFLAHGAALAQSDYPGRPVRILVGQTPGGPTDIPARLLAQRLSDRMGQPFVVENRPGAASAIATEAVAKAPKDGHTLLMISPQHVTNPYLYPTLPYDSVKDFAPVSLVSKAVLVLVVHPDVPVKTFGELLAYVRERPGKVNWSSAGNGGTGHLALELLRAATGIDVVHVPYKGAQASLTDLVAGRVQMAFDSVTTSNPHVRAGRLRPIVVTSTVRAPMMPEVPTVAESGIAGYEAVGFAALLAPAGTPREIIARLSQEVSGALRQGETREQILRIGMEPVGSSPPELDDYLREEFAKWGKIIREAKIKAE